MSKISFKIDARKVVLAGHPAIGTCCACKASGPLIRHGIPNKVPFSFYGNVLQHKAGCPMNKILDCNGSFKSNKLPMIKLEKELNEILVGKIDLSDVHCLACGAFGNVWQLGFYGYPSNVKRRSEKTLLKHKAGCPMNKLLNDGGGLK